MKNTIANGLDTNGSPLSHGTWYAVCGDFHSIQSAHLAECIALGNNEFTFIDDDMCEFDCIFAIKQNCGQKRGNAVYATEEEPTALYR